MGDEVATTGADTGATDTVLTGDTDAAESSIEQNSDTGAAAPDEDAGTEGAGDTDTEGSQTSPDTYADFVMPEGMTLDGSVLDEATPLFKELGATQEQAQKLMDLAAKQIQAGSQTQVDTFNQLMSDWRVQAKADKEFGGDKFDENVKVAQSAIGKYGTPELKQLLEDHGVGNHPEVIRFMVRVGRTLSEDVPGSTGVSTSQKTDRASILYPNDK